MKACALAGMLVLALDDVSAAAVADPDPLSIAPAATALSAVSAKPGFPLSDDAIKKAVRESLAQEPRAALKLDGAVLRGDRYQAFSRQFSEAQKPS